METELDYVHLLTTDVFVNLLWYEHRLVFRQPARQMVSLHAPQLPVSSLTAFYLQVLHIRSCPSKKHPRAKFYFSRSEDAKTRFQFIAFSLVWLLFRFSRRPALRQYNAFNRV